MRDLGQALKAAQSDVVDVGEDEEMDGGDIDDKAALSNEASARARETLEWITQKLNAEFAPRSGSMATLNLADPAVGEQVRWIGRQMVFLALLLRDVNGIQSAMARLIQWENERRKQLLSRPSVDGDNTNASSSFLYHPTLLKDIVQMYAMAVEAELGKHDTPHRRFHLTLEQAQTPLLPIPPPIAAQLPWSEHSHSVDASSGASMNSSTSSDGAAASTTTTPIPAWSFRSNLSSLPPASLNLLQAIHRRLTEIWLIVESPTSSVPLTSNAKLVMNIWHALSRTERAATASPSSYSSSTSPSSSLSYAMQRIESWMSRLSSSSPSERRMLSAAFTYRFHALSHMDVPDVGLMVQLLHRMQQLNLQPSTKLYNGVLTALIDVARQRRRLDAVANAPRNQATAESRDAARRAAAALPSSIDCFQQMQRILQEMRKNDQAGQGGDRRQDTEDESDDDTSCRPNVHTYLLLLRAFRSTFIENSHAPQHLAQRQEQLKSLVALYEDMLLTLPIHTPTTQLLNSFMFSFLHLDAPKYVIQMYQNMIAHGRVDEHGSVRTGDGDNGDDVELDARRGGDADRLDAAFSSMLRWPLVQPNSSTFDLVMQAMYTRRDLPAALQCYSLMMELTSRTSRSRADHGISSDGKPHTRGGSDRLLEEVRPYPETYLTFMRLLWQVDIPEMALPDELKQAIQQQDSSNSTLTAQSSTPPSASTSHRRRTLLVRRVYADMQRFGIAIDRAHVIAISIAHLMAKGTDGLMEWMDEWERNHPHVLQTLRQKHGGHAPSDDAARARDRPKPHRGKVKDEDFFPIRITNYLAKQGDWERLYEMHERLRPIKPNHASTTSAGGWEFRDYHHWMRLCPADRPDVFFKIIKLAHDERRRACQTPSTSSSTTKTSPHSSHSHSSSSIPTSHLDQMEWIGIMNVCMQKDPIYEAFWKWRDIVAPSTPRKHQHAQQHKYNKPVPPAQKSWVAFMKTQPWCMRKALAQQYDMSAPPFSFPWLRFCLLHVWPGYGLLVDDEMINALERRLYTKYGMYEVYNELCDRHATSSQPFRSRSHASMVGNLDAVRNQSRGGVLDDRCLPRLRAMNARQEIRDMIQQTYPIRWNTADEDMDESDDAQKRTDENSAP